MIYCVECGTENDSNSRFCIHCGAEIFVPDEVIEKSALDAQVIAVEETVVEPKKRGRKPKVKEESVESAEVIGEAEPPEEVAIEPLEIDSVDEPIITEESQAEDQEPEALEWNDTKQSPKRYVPPVMPSETYSQNGYYRPSPPINSTPYSNRVAEPPITRNIDGKIKPLSTAAYFWLRVLYSIPGIGFIMLVILSIAPSNLNLKRFSRASLIYRIIFYCMFTIICLAAIIVLQHVDWPYCNEIVNHYGWGGWTIRIW